MDDVSNHRCFEEEMRGVLSSRCDEYHKFNVDQRTRHECRFLREVIQCRVALVSSGCGSEAGNFALDLLKVTHKKHLHKLKCQISRENNFKAFRYTDTCSRSFLEEIETCTSRHLTEENVANFHGENDLVSTETERNFRGACRAYRKFLKCIEPINDTCSGGVKVFLDYEGSLRRYMLKMNHICHDDVIDVYASSLRCYQSVMSNGQLNHCNVHWNNLGPWLRNITAYQFFCNSNHTNTVNLLMVIQRSHLCHVIAFQSECGHNSSKIMATLMDLALRDPLYLRLGFRPDCSLHDEPDVTLPEGGEVFIQQHTTSTDEPGSSSTLDASHEVQRQSTQLKIAYVTSPSGLVEPSRTSDTSTRAQTLLTTVVRCAILFSIRCFLYRFLLF